MVENVVQMKTLANRSSTFITFFAKRSTET